MADELFRNSERRRETRIPARVELHFSQAAEAAKAFKAFSVNFSPGGLCVRMKPGHQIGDRLALTMEVEGQAFTLEAVVQWIRGPVAGVRFDGVTAEDRERLERVAEVLGARPPPEDEDLEL